MIKVFNRKFLFAIPAVFFIVLIFKIYFNFISAKEYAYDFARKDAEVIASYSETHRDYYQKLYINKDINLNKKTLLGLPAYSSNLISNVFSKKNTLNIKVRTVSDRARNPKNKADKSELKAIEFFKKNKNKKQYFNDSNKKFYQFAKVLKITKKCLMCHGKQNDAPKFIRTRYDKAYNYKIGDVRGILSIKIPKKKVDQYFLINFLISSAYDFLILLFLFIIIYYLAQKSKKINTILEEEIKLKTLELKNSLMKDRLTAIPNRLSLIEDLKYEDSIRHLAIVNIDNFKDINDLYGFEIGDYILKKIANFFKTVTTNINFSIYKLPSDEFAILSQSKISQQEFKAKISDIIDLIHASKYEKQDISIFIRLSCGIVSGRRNLLIKADMSLNISKNTKKSIVVYKKDIDTKEKIRKNITGIKLIQDAMLNDLIVPYFQPIYDLKTKKITKFESLVRIINHNGEVVPPANFLEIAYKAKLYPFITKEMIKRTFSYFSDKEFEFSINLSIQDILDKNIYNFIINKLNEYRGSNRVVFEILETDEIKNYDDVNVFIKEVKKFGCKIAIDDFGKGYSNFSHIMKLDIDYLKIDATLIKNIHIDKNSSKIVKTIVYFANNLNIKSIAEYVENREIYNILEEIGVDFIQGYYIGKPEANIQKDF